MKKFKLKKSWWIVICLLLFTVFLLVVGFLDCRYYFFKNHPLFKDEKSYWKTYKNQKDGYMIRYPEESTQIIESDKRVKFLINGQLDQHQNLMNGMQIEIQVIDFGTRTAREALSRHIDILEHEDDIWMQQIGGLEAYSVKFKFPDWIQYTEVIKDEKLYELSIATKGDNQENKLGLANQILSTFEFTN